MAAITKGVDPRNQFSVALFCRDRGNCSQNLAHVAGYVELIDCSSRESANCYTEVCNRFGHIFGEVAGDLSTGHLSVVVVISARVRDDLDIDLLAEPQGLVARHCQRCVCRGLVDEIDEVSCGDGRVWRCVWLTRLRCGVQADDGVEVGQCSSL